MPWRIRGTLVSWANCSVGVQSCPTTPRRSAVRLDPTRLWYVRVRIRQEGFPFIRVSEETFIFDALGGKRDGCVPGGGPTRRRRVLTGPAPPSRCPAPPHRLAPPRSVPPVVCPGFRFDRYMLINIVVVVYSIVVSLLTSVYCPFCLTFLFWVMFF